MADAKQLTGMLNSTGSEGLDPQRPDLDRAYKALQLKLDGYNNLWDYYDGDQPLMYTASRLNDIFAELDSPTFVENWCAVVIDAANDRINIASVGSKDATDDKLIKETWEELELDLEASDVHEAALVIGESFVIAWPPEEGEIDVFYNDPRLVHLFYDPANPRKKWYAAKWWVAGDEYIRMTLYYPDRLEYYRSTGKAANVASSKAFVSYNPGEIEGGEVAANPYEEIPVFHFRPERRKVKGDLVNVIPPQNGINKLVTDLMVAAEYGAFKQRYIIANADTSNLENSPGMIWEIPAGDGMGQQTSVGEFDATELSNYIDAIDHLAASVAVISRTPKHFIMQGSNDLSGEALIAMEAPLNKRCQDHIDKFVPVWKELIQFMLKVLGSKVDKKDISVIFDKAETVQPKTEAEIRTSGKAAGIPLVTLLRDEGKDPAWIEQMEEDKAAETEANSASLANALMANIRNANNPEEMEPDA